MGTLFLPIQFKETKSKSRNPLIENPLMNYRDALLRVAINM